MSWTYQTELGDLDDKKIPSCWHYEMVTFLIALGMFLTYLALISLVTAVTL